MKRLEWQRGEYQVPGQSEMYKDVKVLDIDFEGGRLSVADVGAEGFWVRYRGTRHALKIIDLELHISSYGALAQGTLMDAYASLAGKQVSDTVAFLVRRSLEDVLLHQLRMLWRHAHGNL